MDNTGFTIMVTFVNEKRVCGKTVEGFGPDAHQWVHHEVKCPCGVWTREYGEVSEQVGDNPDHQAFLCPKCAAVVLANWDNG